jgi:hypothetical protein
MTTQVLEQIIYNEKNYTTRTEPLCSYLRTNEIELPSQSSACWRGYIGHWEIKKERLYLINIRSYRKHPRHIQPSIQQFFPNQAEVFAEWFNGIIQLKDGKRLKSFGRAGYLFEKNISLTFVNGILISTTVVNNNTS